MKILSKVMRILIYVLPAVLFFSYYPVISLGNDESMNFELSLPLVWLMVFDVLFVVTIFIQKRWREVWKDICTSWKWLLLPGFITITILWSLNMVRGILTCGIMWLVAISIYGMIKMKATLCKNYDERVFGDVFLKMFLVSSLLICVWCVTQCVLDTLGVSAKYTLMCKGCTVRMFGFPHPNGFAIEPQFMGNLLLAPAVVTAWLAIKNDSKCCKNYNISKFFSFRFLLSCFFVIVATLFLTFSRGAIYGFAVGMMFMTGYVIVRYGRAMWKRLGIVWGLMILAFLATLNVQGILTQVGPTKDTYIDGVAKVLNQLSLGIIEVRSEKVVENSEEGEEAVFDGYVEESTGIRMELTKNAFLVWGRDLKTMLFGVGIGGAGRAMYEAGLTGSPKEIVQNEYASLLAETGIVGVGLLVVLVVMVVKALTKSQYAGMLFTLFVMYGVTLLFFSGFANALQIYLMPGVLYAVLEQH